MAFYLLEQVILPLVPMLNISGIKHRPWNVELVLIVHFSV